MWISRKKYEELIRWLIKNETKVEKLKTRVIRLEYILKDELSSTLSDVEGFINAFCPDNRQ